MLLAAVQDTCGERWVWPDVAAAAVLVAGIGWVAVAVTRVNEQRGPLHAAQQQGELHGQDSSVHSSRTGLTPPR